MDKERHSGSTVQFGEVRRCGQTKFHRCRTGSECGSTAILLVDILQLTNPNTLLILVSRRNSDTTENSHIHRLVFRQGETGLQVHLYITDSAGLTTIFIPRAIRIAPHRQAEIIIINRNRGAYIKIVPNAKSKTHIGIQSHKFGNLTISFVIRSFLNHGTVQVLEPVCIIKKGKERQLGMSKGLAGLGFVHANKTFFIYRLRMGCISTNGKGHR